MWYRWLGGLETCAAATRHLLPEEARNVAAWCLQLPVEGCQLPRAALLPMTSLVGAPDEAEHHPHPLLGADLKDQESLP